MSGTWEGHGWACAECDAVFPATGRGYTQIRQHCADEHPGIRMGECCRGVIDLDSGVVLAKSYSPSVLTYARRMGWVEPKQAGPGRTPTEEAGVDAEIVTLGTESRRKGPGRKSIAQSARLIMKDVDLDPGITPIFIEAQWIWPELYPDNSPESMTNFIRDFVCSAAVVLGLNTFSQSFESMLNRMSHNEEDGGLPS